MASVNEAMEREGGQAPDDCEIWIESGFDKVVGIGNLHAPCLPGGCANVDLGCEPADF